MRFGLLCLFALACGGEAPRPELLVITLDTTRADRMGAYGQSPSPTPNFDHYAALGWLADEAMTVTPLTLPAHSSLFTGLYPHRHGVRDNGQRLGVEYRTLAEMLNEGGYETSAFVSSVVLDSTFGLDQGFDHYADGFDMGAAMSQRGRLLTHPAEWVTQQGLAHLSTSSDGSPRFMWAHYYDAHLPLSPPPHTLKVFPEQPYMAELMRVDEQWKALWAAFEAKARGPAYLVVVGDHGESHGEHGEPTHGQFVYRSSMRVPFLIYGPEVPNRREASPVSLVDLMPSLLPLMGLSVSMDSDGENVLSKSPAADRWVYGETFHPRYHFGFSELHVIQSDEQRYIQAPDPELYRYRTDPGELKNRYLGLTDAEREQLDSAMASFLVHAQSSGAAAKSEISELKALEALGYLSGPAGVSDAVDGLDLPDPKTVPDIVHRFEAARDLARSQPPEKGAVVLEAFLAEFPNVSGARIFLTEALRLTGEFDRAQEVLAPLLKIRPNDAALLLRSGELYLGAKAFDAAEEVLRKAIALHPEHTSVYAVLAELQRRQGRCDLALQTLRDGREKGGDDSRCMVVEGACMQSQENWSSSVTVLSEAARLDPINPDVHTLLGMGLVRTGRVQEGLTSFQRQLELTPNHGPATAGAGMAYYQLGQYENAARMLTRIVDDESLGIEPPLAYADALIRMDGDLKLAEIWLNRASKRSPRDHRVHRVRAALYMALGDVDAALLEMNRSRGVSE